MNRYTKSFSITVILYVLLGVSFLYSFDSPKTLQAEQKKSNQVVKFTIIQEQILDKEPKKVLKQKVTKKSPQIKKKVITKEFPKKKAIVQKQAKKTSQIAKKQIKKNKSTLTTKKETLDEINKRKIQQQKYYTQIKTLINKNKYYPRMAVKRGIEGMVKIQLQVQLQV